MAPFIGEDIGIPINSHYFNVQFTMVFSGHEVRLDGKEEHALLPSLFSWFLGVVVILNFLHGEKKVFLFS